MAARDWAVLDITQEMSRKLFEEFQPVDGDSNAEDAGPNVSGPVSAVRGSGGGAGSASGDGTWNIVGGEGGGAPLPADVGGFWFNKDGAKQSSTGGTGTGLRVDGGAGIGPGVMAESQFIRQISIAKAARATSAHGISSAERTKAPRSILMLEVFGLTKISQGIPAQSAWYRRKITERNFCSRNRQPG